MNYNYDETLSRTCRYLSIPEFGSADLGADHELRSQPAGAAPCPAVTRATGRACPADGADAGPAGWAGRARRPARRAAGGARPHATRRDAGRTGAALRPGAVPRAAAGAGDPARATVSADAARRHRSGRPRPGSPRSTPRCSSRPRAAPPRTRCRPRSGCRTRGSSGSSRHRSGSSRRTRRSRRPRPGRSGRRSRPSPGPSGRRSHRSRLRPASRDRGRAAASGGAARGARSWSPSSSW